MRRVHEEILEQRELLDAVLNTNLAAAAVRQNEAIRKVSGWAAIITVPTLIASIYGMNFEHMPELGWRFGYAFAIGVMIAVTGTGFWYFRRKDWL